MYDRLIKLRRSADDSRSSECADMTFQVCGAVIESRLRSIVPRGATPKCQLELQLIIDDFFFTVPSGVASVTFHSQAYKTLKSALEFFFTQQNGVRAVILKINEGNVLMKHVSGIKTNEKYKKILVPGFSFHFKITRDKD